MSTSSLHSHLSIQWRTISITIVVGFCLVCLTNLMPNVFTSPSGFLSSDNSADSVSNAAFDSDVDNDGVDDATDNCLSIANADQLNSDSDSLGDACDLDDDNDGVTDASDNCALVPNAQKIAFVAGPEGARDVWVMNPDGTNPVQLTVDPAEDVAPVFSPNGLKIAFTSRRDGNFEIYSMNSDGTNQTRLTNNPANDQRGAFSSDGTRIAFASDRGGADLDIYVMNADGSGPVRLTSTPGNDFQPVFSPDGKKIYFTSERDGNPEIYVMNADGSSPVNLSNNSANDGQPDIRRDGMKMAFTSNRSGNFEIFVMNSDGSNPTNLTNHASTDTEPSFSPDGSKITWRSGRNLGVLVMNADGSGESSLSNSVFNKHMPSWGGGADTDGDGLGDACDDPSCNSQIPGLISWWRGEGNALDAAGPNHGTLQGNVTYASGKLGQAFKFQNFFQEKVYIDSRVYKMSGGTTSLWFNWDGNQFVHGSNVMIGSSLGGVRRSPLFGVDAGFLLWEFGSLTRMGTNTQVIPGKWYHAVLTYDSDYNIKVYVNGVLVSGGTSADPVEFRNNMGFGNWNDVNTTAGFGGLVDEVQIYDRPLSDCEVSNLYNSANGLPCGVCDSAAPVTTAQTNPAANNAGWNNSDVDVSLSAVDNAGGSGVSQISYRASGAQTINPTIVSAADANILITVEGETTITYFATDIAGNIETEQTLVVKIDKSAPSIVCAAADGVWHADDVTIACTANDSISGLVQLADSNFTLATNVALSTETSNASTNSLNVCDVAGNCSTAGPISGNKVDKKAPTVTITSPSTDAVYLLNQPVAANYSCTDNGSGVSSCIGPVASGSNFYTASVGAKSFTVTANDAVGNVASPSVVNYFVAFGIEVLYDQTRAHKSGSTVPIKLRLVDANGINVSSSAATVHALSIVQTGTQASSVIEDAGNANPDLDFRYDPGLGAYLFNLKTTGYATGTYVLNFTVASGPTVYSVGFQIRQ